LRNSFEINSKPVKGITKAPNSGVKMVKRYLQKLQQINMVIRTKKHIQVIIQVIIQKIRENKINRRTSTLKIIRINSKSLRR